ncbi:serine/threonine protein kinase, CMGC, dual-specificity [Basidiobolus ranarum]|uniref:dual-specificity kinase n=1 Tax=Basidiobolus ranarum TaxID=34480 RepID=A0ABR2W330_9FUNG
MPNIVVSQAPQPSPRFHRKTISYTEKTSSLLSTVSKTNDIPNSSDSTIRTNLRSSVPNTASSDTVNSRKVPKRHSVYKVPLDRGSETSSSTQVDVPSNEKKTRSFGGTSFFGKLRSQGSTKPVSNVRTNDAKENTGTKPIPIVNSKDKSRARANSLFMEDSGSTEMEIKASKAKRFSSILPASNQPSKPQSKPTSTKSNFTIPLSSRLTRPTKSFELKTADRRKSGPAAASTHAASAAASEYSASNQQSLTSSIASTNTTTSSTVTNKTQQHRVNQPQPPVRAHSPILPRESIIRKRVEETTQADSLSSLSSSDTSDKEVFITKRGSTLSLNSLQTTKARREAMEKLTGSGSYEPSDSSKTFASPGELRAGILSSSSLAAKLSSSRLSLTSNHSRLSCSLAGIDENSTKSVRINDKHTFCDDAPSGRSSILSSASSVTLSRQGTPSRGNTPFDSDRDESRDNTPSFESKTLDPYTILKMYGHKLSLFERGEVLDYPEIHFFGQNIRKKLVKGEGTANFGYDDSKGDYYVILHDHLAYRYEILEVLGKGSFGKVVRVRDHKTGKLMAVKIIRNKKQFHTQALVEVKILECIVRWDPDDAHNLIHMYESFYFRNHLCISFELLDLNLYDHLKANSFQGCSINFIRRVTVQILQALCLLKKHHVVHCDLKPENILLKSRKSSQVKVIDVGSSCFESERIYTYIQSRFYRAPEVILGVPYSMAIDMWSLGCILAELYTAHPLFPGENEKEQLSCIMEAIGAPPAHLVEKSARKIAFFDSNNAPRPVVNSKGKRRRPGHRPLSQTLKCNDDGFLDFVSRCLEWDPQKRMTPEEALRHYWIQGTSPEPRLSRHSPESLVKTRQRRKSMIDKNQLSTIDEQSYFRASAAKPITIRNNKVNPDLGPKSAGLLGTSYQSSIDFLRRHARHKVQD